MRFPKISLSATSLLALAAAYFAFVLNFPFIKQVFQLYQPIGTLHDYFIYTIPFILWAACNVLFQLIALPFVHKIIMPILLLISAAVSYNTLFFNVYFNRDMLDNVLQTTPAESARMLSVSYVMWLICFGIIPAILYVKARVLRQNIGRELWQRSASIVLSILMILAVASVFYQDYASFFRNHNNLKHTIVPSNFIGATVSKIKYLRKENLPYLALGQGSHLHKPDNFRHVTVIVLGETTRAQNWGLNGYPKQTTPKLAARLARGEPIINFSDVKSCGTATALSVPCMFSSLTRETYDEARANRQDNLLDTLQTAGVDVHWVENNSDCKGVCKNIPTTNTIELNLPEFCTDGECLDNIMLPEMDKALNSSNKDTVLVLHTIGSHGPTYFERYTAAEKVFTPTCDTKEINRCSNEQIANTYDNGIIYIDQFLDKVIEKLAARDDWESTLFYVSDHGESLGENGVYLHGTPYAIAPKEQTSVPMLMWFSPTWVKNEPFDLGCLKNRASQPFSHDNVFHTVFSMMDTDLASVKQYDNSLDILAACRK